MEVKTFYLKKDTGRELVEKHRILETLISVSEDLEIPEKLIIDLYKKICDGVCDDITLDQFYALMSESAASCMTKHPDFDFVSRRLIVKDLHRKTGNSFYIKVKRMYENNLYFDESFVERVKEHRKEIQEVINYENDYNLSFFGIRTLERSYLLKMEGKIIERPQDMYMRVALGIHYDSLEDAFETYRLLSTQYFSHATPTMFNSGTKNHQMASCFLLGIEEDTTESIFDTVKRAALISKGSAGLGIHIHNIRGTDSLIRSTGGRTSGIVSVLKIFEATLRCIDQGGKKRPGACAIYIEPWHSDILDFLDLRKNTGKEEMRARDIFTALWIPDLFMQRVQNDENWSLFSPDDVPGLNLVFGDDFKEKYVQAEKDGKARRTIRAQAVWKAIMSSQIETGLPYMLYKDTINKSNNQKHLGVIQTSNLCAEIVQYTSDKEISVCNLSSLGLPSFLVKKGNNSREWHNARIYNAKVPDSMSKDPLLNEKLEKEASIPPEGESNKEAEKYSNHSSEEDVENEKNNSFNKKIKKNESEKVKISQEYKQQQSQKHKDACENGFLPPFSEVLTRDSFTFTTEESEYYFDFEHLRFVVSVAVKNGNKIIDINSYPLIETQTSNFNHRPLGIGVQGIADLFVMLKLPFDSEKARELNILIFETIQYSALEASCELAKRDGTYKSYPGSPASQGILHFDFHGAKPITPLDWNGLRKKIAKYGLRNSLLTSLMPTASTSQIMGFNECFEPFTSNLYSRRTLAGDFQVINKYLLKDLINLNLWDEDMKNILVEQQGSIQNIISIPKNLKELYKTAWELSMKSLINLSSDRQPFIDQTQSLNMFVARPTYQKITSMHFYSWKKKLKTGMYYLRTKPIASAVQFTVDREKVKKSGLLTSELQFSAMNSEVNDECENCSA